ncbi:MAG: hypothetical protein ACT4PU_08520 [Planctomycetota bacterium]
MRKKLTLARSLETVVQRLESFEASESVANTGTGSRREGSGFERLVGEFWAAVVRHAIDHGAASSAVTRIGGRSWTRLSVRERSLYLPTQPIKPKAKPSESTDIPSRWLDVAFPVTELVAAFPSEMEAIKRYAPQTGPFSGSDYPSLYSGLTTRFDDTLVLEQGGILVEKVLLEYKTAKSSRRRHIDGNAHERLSFQIMQYLEVATRYPRCSLVVLANGAFVKYRNKYHVNFQVQADRLTCFSWFSMEYACTASQYTRLAGGLLTWLFEGKPRRRSPVL